MVMPIQKKPIKSSLECLQIAWAYRLRDFRQWCKPEGQAVYAWKQAPLKQAIFVCRSEMMDDAKSMMDSYQKNINAQNEKGQSAILPIMITAIAPIQTPPEHDQVVGHSDWLDVILTNDPSQRIVQMRTIPSAFRCQIAFFCPDKHGAMMVANEFCAYFKHESKRTFKVEFELGYAVDDTGENIAKLTDTWDFRVLDNSLYPDVGYQDAKNLTVAIVDCTFMGLIPVVAGLGGEWDAVTDTIEQGTPDGYTPIMGDLWWHWGDDGSLGNGPFPDFGNPWTGHSPELTWGKGLVVTDADVYYDVTGQHTHIHADKDTGEITQTELGDKP